MKTSTAWDVFEQRDLGERLGRRVADVDQELVRSSRLREEVRKDPAERRLVRGDDGCERHAVTEVARVPAVRSAVLETPGVRGTKTSVTPSLSNSSSGVM
jgi:hypothetical protein